MSPCLLVAAERAYTPHAAPDLDLNDGISSAFKSTAGETWLLAISRPPHRLPRIRNTRGEDVKPIDRAQCTRRYFMVGAIHTARGGPVGATRYHWIDPA